MAYPISVGAFTFDHGQHPWWPRAPGVPGVPKNAGKLRGEEGVLSGLHGERPGPQGPRRLVVDLGRLCFILRWFLMLKIRCIWFCWLFSYWIWSSNRKKHGQSSKFSTYDKSSLKACHVLRKNKLVFSNYARDQHAEVLFHGELRGPSNSVSSVEPASVPRCFWTQEGGFGLW